MPVLSLLRTPMLSHDMNSLTLTLYAIIQRLIDHEQLVKHTASIRFESKLKYRRGSTGS